MLSFLFILISVFTPEEQGCASEFVAQVVTLTGVVSVSLKNNDKIYEGAVIKTGANSSVKLLFTDDSIMDIGPDSEFKIDEYKLNGGSDRKGFFSLSYGKLRSLVTKPVGERGSYKVKTGGAIMGVRGTEFILDTPFSVDNSAKPTVIVSTGTVAVNTVASSPATGSGPSFDTSGNTSASSTSVQVTAGQSMTVSNTPGSSSSASGGSDSTTPIQNLSTGQLQSARGEARIQDNTFIQAVSVGETHSSNTDHNAGTNPARTEGGSGNLTMMAATMALQETVTTGASSLAGAIPVQNVPTGISLQDVFTAPPVMIVPGSIKNISITVQ